MKAARHTVLSTPSANLRGALGFTIMELLAVVAIILIILALISPALRASKNQAQGLMCLQNLRSLQTAWTMYAGEHRECLPGVDSGSFPGPGKWVSGWLDFSSSTHNTNTLYLLDPRYAQLGPYVQDAALYKCPADRSQVRMHDSIRNKDVLHDRVRSVSMNCWMNYVGTGDIGQTNYQIFRKTDDIVDISPSKAWVFIDEREDSINDGVFFINMVARGASARIVDFPASYHNRAAGMAYADGHVQLKRWLDPRTTPELKNSQLLLDIPSPSNPDVSWLQERSSVRRKLQ